MYASPIQNLPLQWTAVIGSSLVAAFFDLRSRRIPNWITGPLFLSGLIVAGICGGWSRLGECALAAVLLALPYIFLFIFAGGGAADAKLMGAVGAWVGLRTGCAVLVAVCVSGAVMGIVYSIAKGRAKGVFANIMWMGLSMFLAMSGRRKLQETRPLMPQSKEMLTMPYGLAILAGVCIVALRDYFWNGSP